MTEIKIDTDKIWDAIKIPVFIILIVVVIAIAGVAVYDQGRADALFQQQQVTAAAQPPQPQPTPVPTATPSPYPETVSVTVTGANGPPGNMFPEVVDNSGRIYDISNSGSVWQNIIPYATYDIYVTGERQQFGETIYETGWITYVNSPVYYYSSAGPACGYNGYTCYPYNSYSSTVYWDGAYYYTFQSDNYWHASRSFDVTRGRDIVNGSPPKDRIRW